MEKRKIIIVFIVLILIVIVGLWGNGIIPKRIARISASNYLEKNFPKMQLEYVDIEWSSSFGGYSIKFKDANNKTYSFIMNNKYFPISLGQGLFTFEEEYRQKYEWQDTNIENNEESYFYGKVIESNAKYIIVEPNENEEERKSADKISVGLGENNDALYTIGTNVKITYDGTILESYPAQVKATKIEIKSAENFEILFKDRQPIDSYNKIYVVLDKSETDKYNYTIYAYDGSVNIKIDGKEYSLKDALLESKITMEEIIQKANKDLDNNKITGDMYKDGGSMIYQYDTYTIIKCHTIEGNRDVYIGTKEMTLNDVR